MKIAVCDDEQMYSSILTRIIQQWSARQEQVIKLRVYESAEAFLKEFERGAKVDLAFLDIHMDGMNGFELARRVRQSDINMLIVFITNLRDYVFEGYEVSAFRYLIKPIREKKVLEVLYSASEIYRQRSTSYFTVRTEVATLRVAKCDILYFATQSHYINVHTFDGVHKFRGKLSMLDREFPQPMFTKCNRGILVNVSHIHCIQKDRVTVINKEDLPLSRLYWEEVNRCYLDIHMPTEADTTP